VMLTARASGDPVPGSASNTYVQDVVAAGVRVFSTKRLSARKDDQHRFGNLLDRFGEYRHPSFSINYEINAVLYSQQLAHGARERLRKGSRSLHRVRSGRV